MEPERPIEKALREYADQRRRQAGAPLELHPATRRLLQGEVRRKFPQKPEARPGMFGWLTASWQHLAGSLAVVALVITVTTIALTSHKGPGSETRLARLDQAQPAAPPSESAIQVKGATERDVAVLREVTNAVAVRAPALDKVTLNEPAAASGVARAELADAVTASAQSKAKSPDLAVASEERARPAANGLQPPAPSPTAPGRAGGASTPSAAPPPAVPTAGDAASFGGAVGGRQADELSAARRFNRFPDATQTLSFASQSSSSSVLRSFRVEQKGANLRVVDTDGSVYLGTVEQPDQAPGKELDRETESLKDRAQKQAVSPPGPDGTASAQTNAGGFSFRVTGTNRTANALVVFTGRLTAGTNLGTLSASTNPAVGAGPQRISGKAQIGGREIGIEAVQGR